ncbi:grpE protein homolog 2, mitochondrial-like [Salvia hispanica]|uniref:grpE protein homolog 2, mitochondrial-like n=1 Tax=Salvia hispanica TaxID=49212 RepID=UPI0020099DCC|nr:grpE protein homolog 2, mitochondrial-like [Salvia hispanica]
MSLRRITTRFSTFALTQSRNSGLLSGRRGTRKFQTSSNYLVSLHRVNDMVVPAQVSSLHHSVLSSTGFQWFGFSSSASTEPSDKETMAHSGNEKEIKDSNEASSDTDDKSESDLESELSRDELVKLIVEKEQLLVKKQEEFDQMKDKVLRSFAEMENVKERTRRESENVKKFAIQNFAKSLLDVADNLGRASSAAKGGFSKVDAPEDAAGAVKQLKTLLEGVEMTEKQLAEVFRKFGLEKYDPTDEEFDPARHNAVFQVPDASKPAGRVAVVLKAGYELHDRVIRPADVGVTVAANNEEAE